MQNSTPSPPSAPLLSTLPTGIAALTHLGIIRAQGEDAAQFLHNQLTQDFVLLGVGETRLAAFCSAKGRMQASFMGFKRSATEVLLLCNQDLLTTTLKRLSMFVLRAKVKLSDATADFDVLGLIGDVTLTQGGQVMSCPPSLDQSRGLWLGPTGTVAAAGISPSLDAAWWHWAEVHSGVASLSQPVFEAFVPQMLNYESVGGVNFKKGCYPGQEIVARSQFRGTLKRRAYVVQADAAMQAGQELFSAADTEQPCGLVVQSAQRPGTIAGQTEPWAAIVSVQIASVAQGLRVGSANGPALSVLPLPYALLDDI